jgi:hypothetical protein
MKLSFKLTFTVLVICLIAHGPACYGADELTTVGKNSGGVAIKLKDFKFKPPKSVLHPEEVFVFDEDADRLSFYTNGPAEAKFKVRDEGEYDLIISASGDSAMNTRPKFKVTIDDKDVGKEVSLKDDEIKDYVLPAKLTVGDHKFTVAFTNDLYKEGEYDSNLYIHAVKIRPHRAAAGGETEKVKPENK